MPPNRAITVYGASGHTGRFVVSELARRGWAAVVAGRDAARLAAFGRLKQRVAEIDDRDALDRALAGSAAVINCAGSFAHTAAPIIEAAMRAGIPYLDTAAEIEANLDTFANYAERARAAGITIVPAMAFFGNLGNLLATAAVADWPAVDSLSIAYGLSGWQPTLGTRAAGQVSRQRRNGRRIVFADGQLELRDGAAPVVDWNFPAPLGKQRAVSEFTMTDTVTISRHVNVPEIGSYMTLSAVTDILDPDMPPPVIDESGRSTQIFAVEVIAHRLM